LLLLLLVIPCLPRLDWWLLLLLLQVWPDTMGLLWDCLLLHLHWLLCRATRPVPSCCCRRRCLLLLLLLHLGHVAAAVSPLTWPYTHDSC
jgi:hypothetical protein